MDRMAHLFELKREAVSVEDYGTTQRSNKWSKINDTIDEGSQTEMSRK